MTAPAPRPRSRPSNGGRGLCRAGSGGDKDQRQPSFFYYKSGLWEDLLERTNSDFDSESEGQEEEERRDGQEKRQDEEQGGDHSRASDLKLHLTRLSRYTLSLHETYSLRQCIGSYCYMKSNTNPGK